MDFHGTVCTWNEAGGFGFVRLPDGRDIFFHRTVVQRAGLGDSLPVGRRSKLTSKKTRATAGCASPRCVRRSGRH